MECYLMGIEFQCAKEKEFCKWVVVNIFNATELYTLKWLRWLFLKRQAKQGRKEVSGRDDTENNRLPG